MFDCFDMFCNIEKIRIKLIIHGRMLAILLKKETYRTLVHQLVHLEKMK